MNKRIVIKIGPGSIDTGYAAAVQIGDEGTPPQVETQATLSPAPDLPQLYQRWREAYLQLGANYRIKAHDGVSNVSTVADIESCRSLSRQLRDRTHQWLNGEVFRPIREKLLEQLSPQDHARILLQTKDPLLQRLPWYELEFFQRYRQAEVGVCAPNYQQVSYPGTRSDKVRILAVLGNATNLNTQVDQSLLNNLEADIHFLKEPSRETFNRSLWDAKGWDILFFAGHSSSQPSCSREGPESPEQQEGSGEILLNATDKLTIPQLKHALKKAIDRGLNTAIFNSCDGLGLAADLADLHIPQVLVMREPVPDQIAHAFLQGFLDSFSSGTPFYLAVREAREQLQGLEAQFPCATWLPVIVQNLAEVPPTWQTLQGKPSADSALPRDLAVVPHEASAQWLPTLKHRLKLGLACGIVVATAVLAIRQLGFLEKTEVTAYDHLLKIRPTEPVDSRLLIITNTDADVAKYPEATGRSMSDDTLLALLNKLKPLAPKVIGLDIYRSHAAESSALEQQITSTDNLLFICKSADYTTDTPAEPPPPELGDPSARLGASDFVYNGEPGGKLRRHLMVIEPSVGSPCQVQATFSSAIALRYAKTIEDWPINERIPPEESNNYFGQARLPWITTSSWGGYHDVDTQGYQILLNYRILKDPAQTNCGDVKETPADCMTVSAFLETDPSQLQSLIEDRIVLIGTTALEFTKDRWLTPYTETPNAEGKTPGVFLQAQMISQLLSAALENRLLLTIWPDWVEMMWIVGWALLGGLISVYARGSVKLWLWLLVGEGLLLLACWLWLVEAGVWVPWVPSVIALPAAALSTTATTQAKTKLTPFSLNASSKKRL
ncbi:MAG: CHASE2 domain-containing protein [Cyanobacteria bacterium P01_F01_bin.53]